MLCYYVKNLKTYEIFKLSKYTTYLMKPKLNFNLFDKNNYIRLNKYS